MDQGHAHQGQEGVVSFDPLAEIELAASVLDEKRLAALAAEAQRLLAEQVDES